MRRRLEAVEMWFVSRMLRIPWIVRRTNEEVLRRAGVKKIIDENDKEKAYWLCGAFIKRKLL